MAATETTAAKPTPAQFQFVHTSQTAATDAQPESACSHLLTADEERPMADQYTTTWPPSQVGGAA